MRRLLALPFAALLLAGFQSAPTRKPAPAEPAARPSPSPTPPPLLTGTVKGPDWKPVEDALVVASIVGSEERTPLTTKTDAQGAFKLPLPKAAPVDLRVEKRGLAIRRFERWPPAKPLDVQLARGGVIEGTLRDGTSGTLVADARVEARSDAAWDQPLPWDPDAGGVHAKSDAKGHYRLEGLGAGTYSVGASARGHGEAWREGAKVGSPLDLFLFAGASISGTVLAPDGKPAPGAVILARSVQGRPGPTGMADPEGHFDLFQLTAGIYNVIARLSGLAPAIAPEVVVESDGETHQDLTLRAGGRILGRLVSSADRPVVGGRVLIEEAGGVVLPRNVQELLQATASDDGRFQLEAAPPGPIALLVSGHAVAPLRVEAEVRDGAVTDVGDVVLERGTTIEGHIRDRAGNGIGDARVSASRSSGTSTARTSTVRPEARTDADGGYVLAGVEAGTYNVMVQAPGFASARLQAEAGTTNADAVLDSGGSITGLVVDDTGRALQSFEVTVEPKASGPWEGQEVRKEVVSDDGRFTVDDLGDGTFVVEVAASQFAPATVSDVRVAPGVTTDIGRVRLAAGGVARGIVVSSDGTGVPGASVHARTSPVADSGRYTTETDGQGAFELRGLPTGKVDLVTRHPSFADGYAGGVDVDPSKLPAETRIVLSRGGRIEGTARKRDATPVSGASVLVRSEPAWSSDLAPIAPDGSFAVDRVPAGHVAVLLMAGAVGGYLSLQRTEADVREGETTRVDFISREILVSGRVTRGSAPAPGLRIDMRRENQFRFMTGSSGGAALPPSGPQRGEATTAEDGGYALIVDSPGSYRVSVETAEERSLSGWRRVEVPDAETFTYDLDIGGVPLTGSVTDKAKDAPIVGALVLVRTRIRDEPSYRDAQTGADGRFELVLPAGDYTVTVHAEGYASGRAEVTVGDMGGDVRLALARGVMLKGRVLDPAGRPAADCPVSATAGTEAEASTDEATTLPDGSFQLKGLRPTPHAVLAGSSLSGFAFQAGVSPGGEAVTLTLQPGGQARVRVRGVDRAPISGATGLLTRVNGALVEAGFADAFGRSDPSGILVIPLPAGADEIEVRKDKLVGRVTVNVPSGGSAAGEVTLRPSE
jgi:hypothetical protein